MERGLQNMKRQENLAIWAERVEACRSSGMSVKQWCAENGIVPNTYFRWQRKVFSVMCANQDGFYEVPVLRSSERAVANIEINGVSAGIYRGADEETIRALLSAMKSC